MSIEKLLNNDLGKRVLHIGAHRCEAFDFYQSYGFDVVWIEKEESSGRITQICFGESEDFFTDLTMGINMAYLLAEDMNYGLHNILNY